MFLEEARTILARSERAVRLVQGAGRGETGQLALGFVPWADFTDVPEMVRAFGERYPDVELTLHALTVPEQLAVLREGRIQIGILRPPVDDRDLLTEPLLSEPLVVVFPRRHRFAAYERIPWRRLAGEAFVALAGRRAPAFQAVIAHACREAAITLKIRHEVDHPQTVLALVAAGIGVSLVPASIARGKRLPIGHRGLRPAGPRLETTLAWRRDDPSPLITAFLGIARGRRAAVQQRPRPRTASS